MTGTLLTVLLVILLGIINGGGSTVLYSRLVTSQLHQNQLVYDLASVWPSSGLTYKLDHSPSSCPSHLFAVGPSNGSMYYLSSPSLNLSLSSSPPICSTNTTTNYVSLRTYSCFAIAQGSLLSFGVTVDIHIIPDDSFHNQLESTSMLTGTVLADTVSALVQLKGTLLVDGPTDNIRVSIISDSFELVSTYINCYTSLQLVTTKALSPGSSFNLTLLTPFSRTVQVYISVVTNNTNYPTFRNSTFPAYLRLKETTPIGTNILHIIATDSDSDANGIVRYNVNHSHFSIDSITGHLYLSKELNYDVMNHTSLSVVAHDLGYPSYSTEITINIFIVDVNESPPHLTVVGQQEGGYNESLSLDSVVATVIVTDLDSSNVSVNLMSNTCSHCFQLSEEVVHPGNRREYNVSVSDQLDYETNPNGYLLTVLAVDSGVQPILSSTLSLVIKINDINEPPYFTGYPDDTCYTVSVSEGDPIGMQVMFLNTQDDDTGVKGQLVYNIVSGNERNWFKLDETSGLISLSGHVTPSQQEMIQLNISVRDISSDPLTVYTSVCIMINDIDNNAPVFSLSSYSITIPESWNLSTPIFSFRASDSDTTGCSKAIQYTISTAEPPLYRIDSISGLLYANNSLDYEEFNTGNVTVVVRSLGDSSQHINQAILNITITDVNDNIPVIDPVDCPCFILEEQLNNQSCHPLTVRDKDTNNSFQFMILSGNVNNVFTIHPLTGVVSTATRLDHETRSSYTLSIAVSDGVNLSEQVHLQVIVTDINDSPLSLQSSPGGTLHFTRYVPQDTPLQDIFWKLNITQGDTGYNGLTRFQYLPYSSLNSNTMILDPLSGALYLNHSISIGTNYTFRFSAQDFFNANVYSEYILNASITVDRNVPPRFVLNYNEIRVSRNLLVNTTVTTIQATDINEVRYALVGGANNGNLFNIHPVTGIVTIATELMGVSTSTVTLNISATEYGIDDPLSSFTVLKLILYYPTAITDSGARLTQNPGVGVCHYIGYIREGPQTEGGLVTTLAPRQSGQDITYTLLEGGSDYTSVFAIDGHTLVTRNYNNGSAIDRYDNQALFVTLRAIYGDSLFHYCSITVLINDTNNHGPVFDQEVYTVEVYHVTPIGTVIYQMGTTDRDIGLPHVPRYSLSPSSSLFNIEPNTGLVRTSVSLTVGSVHTLTVLAVDGQNASLYSTASLVITVLSTNNVPPIVPLSLLRLTLPENQPLHSTVMSDFGASDNDVGSHGNLKYCIQEGNYNRQFVVERNGSIRLVKELDYEGQPHSTNLTVLVYDASANVQYSHVRIEVNIENVNDETPMFVTPRYHGYIQEDSPSGTFILQVTAHDKDLNDVITYTTNDSRLIIHQTTGALSLASSIDRDTTHISLTVKATDQVGHYSTAEVSVSVLRTVNNRRPSFTNSNNSVINIPENQPIDDVLYTVYAMDTDSGLNALISYWINDDSNNVFSLDGSTGVIKLSRPLDYETDNHTFSLLIDAIDHGRPQLTTGNKKIHVSFQLTNVNDNYPRFTQDIYNCTVLEGGRQVKSPDNGSCQVKASDSDLVGNSITYTITTSDNLFSIHQTSGILTVNSNNINYERTSSYTITVIATDSGSPSLSYQALIKVTVLNINEYSPVFNPIPDMILLPLGLSVNTTLFYAHASDADLQTDITYTFSAPNNVFDINTNTGGVVLKQPITTPTNYTLRVLAFDSNSGASKFFNLVFFKSNLNSLSPQFIGSSNPSMVSVSRRASVGDVVVTMATFDPDAGLDGIPRYYVVSASDNSNHFSINTLNGTITVERSLRGLLSPTVTLTVMAIDSGSRPLYSLFELTIVILQDYKVMFDVPVYNLSVNQSQRFTENIVSHIRAVDSLIEEGGQSTSCNVTYRLAASNGVMVPFIINETTGSLYVRGDLNKLLYQFRVEGYNNVTMETTTSLVSVTVEDNVNDFRPDFPTGFDRIYFPSSLSTNHTIVQMFVTDRDTGIYSQSTFTLSPSSSPFSINSETGLITLTSTTLDVTNLTITAINHNLIRSINITLVPYNNTLNNDTFSSSLSLQLTSNSISLPVNQPIGSIVYTVSATSVNSSLPLFYTITSTNTFTVHPNIGAIYLRESLNFEPNQTNITLSINVYDEYSNHAVFTLVIELVDTNTARLRFTDSSYIFTTPENTPLGTTIGLLELNDRSLPSDDVMFEIIDSLDSESLSLFNITCTGAVVVTGDLDREELVTHVLTVSVKSTLNEEEDLTRLVINIADINDNIPQFRHLPNVIVPEDASLGDEVTIATAFDLDLDDNATIMYSLTSNSLPFDINSTTGVISVSGALNYENVTSYILNIVAFNSRNPLSNSTHSLMISIFNVIDTYPNLSTALVFVSVHENQPPYTYVHHITLALSPHPILYTILNGNELGHFFVEPFTGVIRTLSMLDRESLSSYNLTLRASFNSDYYTDLNVIITVDDINDHCPQSLVSNLTFLLPEGAPVLNEVIFNISLIDYDQGNNGKISTVLILDPVADSLFTINNIGECTLKRSLDREERDRYQFNIIVIDNSTESPCHSSFTITVHVTDINDNDPQFDSDLYQLTVELPTLPGEILWSAYASDKDDNSNDLMYDIIGGTGINIFHMNSQSGVLTISQLFIDDNTQFYTLQISATDEGGRNTTANVHVTLLSCRFNQLSFTPPHYSVIISEDTTVGTIILSPILHEFNRTGVYNFSLISNNSNLFAINSSTGNLYTVSTLDRETRDTHRLVIIVQDISSTLRVAKATVTVTLTDVNDNFPLFINTPYAQFVTDYTPAGTVVHTVVATDNDHGNNSVIYYSIINDPSQSFVINATSGVVSLSQSLDPTILQTYFQVLIQGQDQGSPTHLVSNVTLGITLVNSNAPNFSQALYMATLSEDTDKDTHVVTLSAQGQAENSLIFYSFIDISDPRFPFSLDPQSGLITVNDRGLDYETTNVYSFFVQAEDVRNSLSSQAQVYITITDYNDQRPTFSNALYIVNVMETVAMGTAILQVQATDGDTLPNSQLRYSLVTSTDTFCIDPLTGSIITTNTLDYEMLTRYQLTVKASDSGTPQLEGTANVRIIVTNVNDNPPSFTSLPSLIVSEGASPGTILTFVTATDPDNDIIQYNLTQTSSNNFQISSNGLLRLNTHNVSLTEIQYVLNISASDGIHVIYESLVVNIEDINNHSPLFNQSTYHAAVIENSPANVSLVTLNATDLDRGINAHITYSISDSTFYINSSTGLISTSSDKIDRETTPTFSVIAIARDGGGLTDTTVVMVTVQDINDNPPRFRQDSYVVIIQEGDYNDKEVLTVQADDPDLDSGGTVTYSIVSSVSYFYINSNTGMVKASGPLDYETMPTVSFQVMATDGGGLVSDNVTVTVNLTNVGDTNPTFSETQYHVNVSENAGIGQIILVPNVTFHENCRPSDYEIYNRPSNFPFMFDDGDSGNLRVTGTLNRIQVPTYNFIIRVTCLFITDANGVTQFDPRRNVASVAITVTDVNEPPRIIASDIGSVIVSPRISEAASINTPVLTIRAVDNDVGDNAIVRFRFYSSQSSLPFAISSENGTIYVSDELDRETAPPYYDIRVEAYDLGSPSLSSTATVFITLQDVNDSPPKFICSDKDGGGLCLYNISIPENIRANTSIITLQTEDPDILGNTSFVLSSGFFNVTSHNGNGVVRTARLLDRETNDYYELLILVSDGVHSQRAYLLINVTDINDNPPEFSETQFRVTIKENYPINDVFIIVNATDNDEGDNSIITYSQLDSPVANNISLNSSTGHVMFLVAPDRETSNRLEFHLKASDVGGLEDFATLVVDIIDQNDNYPVFTNNNYTASVYENRSSNVELLYVSATDSDSGSNSLIRYTIDELSRDYFQIDSVTGLIRAKHRLIDREVHDSFNIIVTASDSGEEIVLSTNSTVYVTVLDINDNAPLFTQSSYIVRVEEGTAIGTIIETINVTDSDQGSNAQLIFDLSGNGKDSFTLESVTGGVMIKVNDELNSESVSVYHLSLSATDEGIPALKTTVPLTINILDRNEHKPTFGRGSYEYTLSEGLSIGHVIGAIRANDLDPGDVNLTYSFHGNITDFKVDFRTGNISIAKKLDFETRTSYSLRLIASEPRLDPQTAQTMILITITDINDNPPEFLCPSSNTSCPQLSFSITENTHNVILANLTVRDNDTVTNPNLITFALASSDRGPKGLILFSIDALSGVLSLIYPLDREEKDTYRLTITANDGGPQLPLIGTVQVTVHVLDLNDNGPLDGNQHVFLNIFPEDLLLSEKKVNLYINDRDIINTHTFTTPSPLVSLDYTTGVLTIPQHTPIGPHSIQVTITDTLYNGTILSAVTTVHIEIYNVTNDTREHSFTLLLSQMTSNEFIRNHFINFNNTINQIVSQSLNDTIGLLFVNIKTSPNIVNTRELTLAVYQSSTNTYISPDMIQHILYLNRLLIQRTLHFMITSEDYDMCASEPCSKGGLCSPITRRYSSQSILHTPQVSYLGLEIDRGTNCSCFDGWSGQTCAVSCPGCINSNSPCSFVNCPVTSSCREVKGQGICIDDCDPSPCKHGGQCFRQMPGYYCACPRGYDGPNCELTSATFTGNSYALFPSVPLVSQGAISLEFITNQTHGSLLYAGHYDNSYSDYISIYLYNNSVKCILSYGDVVYELEGDGVTANDKEWITVVLEYSTTEIQLKVTKYDKDYSHKTSVVSVTHDTSYFLDITTPLLLGNLPSQYHNLSNSAHHYTPYKGCLRNILVNGKVLDFTGPLLQEGLSTNCRFTDRNCDSDPCANSGHCIGQWDSFRCQCTDQYTGTNCDNETITGSFTGKEHISYEILTKDGGSQTNRGRRNYKRQTGLYYSSPTTTVYIAFSTTLQQTSAVLLQIGHEDSDHVIIEITRSGYIQLRVDLGGGEKTLNISTTPINDGLSHNVTISRRGSHISLLLDNMYIIQDTLNITNNPLTDVFLDITSLIAGGNLRNDNSGTSSQRSTRNFHGCIQKMSLDGHDLPMTGETSVYRAHSNGAIVSCDTKSPPPTSFITVITTLYVMFAIGFVCLLVTSITFVFLCKASHYSYTKKKGSHTVNSRNRFIDYTPTQHSPASTIDRPFIRQERGLQSTTSFEPLDIASRYGYEAYKRVRDSPSIASESVFEVANEYELSPVPSVIQSSPEIKGLQQPKILLSQEPLDQSPRKPLVQSSRQPIDLSLWQPMEKSPLQPKHQLSREPIVRSSWEHQREVSSFNILPRNVPPPRPPPSLPPPSPPPSPSLTTTIPPSTIIQQTDETPHPKTLELLELMRSSDSSHSIQLATQQSSFSSGIPSLPSPSHPKSLELLELDPMTGMTLHSTSDGVSHDEYDGREEEQEEDEEEEEEEDIEGFIKERLQHADELLTDIDYDDTLAYCEEGSYDPLGSIGSLYDILNQFEHEETNVTQQLSPTRTEAPFGSTRKQRSPKDSSPQKPSPLLQSAKRAPPPLLKPKPSKKPSLKTKPVDGQSKKALTKESPQTEKGFPSPVTNATPPPSSKSTNKKKSSPPKFHQLNKLTGEELRSSPLTSSNRSKLKRDFNGSVTQL